MANKPPKMQVGSLLAQARKDNGHKQRDVYTRFPAEFPGFQAQVSAVESGKRIPTDEQLRAISEYTGIALIDIQDLHKRDLVAREEWKANSRKVGGLRASRTKLLNRAIPNRPIPNEPKKQNDPPVVTATNPQQNVYQQLVALCPPPRDPESLVKWANAINDLSGLYD